MDADGSNQRLLTNTNADDLEPSWSPDNQHILFASRRDGHFEIYMMNADGSDQRRLTNNPSWDDSPAWQP
jgi:Tol biopolymer transport system component